MAARWRHGGASPVDAVGASKLPTGVIMAPLPASRRLAQAASSLEAEYAVLGEASATSAALETMLRNSQPLLWLDDALALQRSKPQVQPPAKGGGARPEKRLSLVARAQSGGDGGDGGGVGGELPWDELFLESELRRRRRIQWEVAKRIARVEREISRVPVAQRSWHVRERKRRLEEEQHRQEELAVREKLQRQQERDERLRVQKETKQARGGEAERVVHVEQTPRVAEPKAKTKGAITKPQTGGDVDLDFEWPSKPVKTNTVVAATVESRPVPDDDVECDDDKENETNHAMESKSSPVKAQVTVDSDGERLMDIVRESLETPVPSVQSPLPPPKSEIKVTGTTTAHDDQDHVDFSSDSGNYLHRQNDVSAGKRSQSDQNTSSLGRQVLSEYRTMATAVSFGAPAITGSRLNKDILRRLFNDLDADRDGHLNRIETCIALSRLHIDVPAPRIVAFFKRICALDADPERGDTRRQRQKSVNRSTTHEPLKELISYKPFAAFVTTAFEQQRQQRSQKPSLPLSERGLTSNDRRLALPPLQMPSHIESTSPSPIVSRHSRDHSSSPTNQQSTHTVDQEPRLIEQHVDPTETDDVADRVLRQIPDYLMVRALACVDSPPRQVQQIVRKSLERISNRTLQDAIVEDVTRDLVQKFAEKLLSDRGAGGKVDDEVEDTSGLKRAARYFESLQLDEARCDISSMHGDDGTVGEDWWHALTEKQVSLLVHEVWRQRQPGFAIATRAEVDDKIESSGSIVSEVMPDPLHGESDASPKMDVKVRIVAEKSVQTGSIEFLPSEPSHSPPVPPPPPPPPSPPLSPQLTSTAPQAPPDTQKLSPTLKTTLAHVIFTSSDQVLERQRRPAKSRTTEILSELRRQRRHRLTTAPVAVSMESMDSTDSLPPEPTSISKSSSEGINRTHPILGSHHQVTPVKVTEHAADVQHVDTSPAPLSVREVCIHSPTKRPTAPDDSVESIRSSHSSTSNAGMSSYSSSLGSSMNLFREMSGSDVWRYAAERRRRRLGRQRRQKSGTSSALHSLDDTDLSEGEIGRNKVAEDLSDGELFGTTRRQMVRAKNIRVADPSFSIHSNFGGEVGAQTRGESLESGELLPSMTALHRKYQQQITRSSVSSLESGEAEDGVVISVDIQDAARGLRPISS